ncbi:MAG: CDP-alcohol phosphatidyltransferase family protein [Deltaproteobacteria bacterium]|nr:CDP-alcohol phosphatidyltransferase family protein [Deltaproteobacteria bacterium]
MLNIPNFFSIARILLVPLFIILLINQAYPWALLTFLVAAVSDAMDGLLARLLHQRTVLGAYLDPAADKLLSASAYITLAILNILPSWLTVLVISRDVIISAGVLILFLSSHRLEIEPSKISKVTTAFQFCTVLMALLANTFLSVPGWLLLFLIWGTAITTVLSGLKYIGKGIKIFNQLGP